MKIVFDQWRGTAEKYTGETLGEGMAVVAHNTLNERNLLEGFYNPVTTGESVPSNSDSLFRYLDTYWFTANDSRVTYAEVAIPNDANDFVVICDASYPKLTTVALATAGGSPYPAQSRRLGIPTLDASRMYATTGEMNDEWPDAYEENYDQTQRSQHTYRITLVNEYGMEGAASSPIYGYAYMFYYKGILRSFPHIFWQKDEHGSLDGITKVRFYRSEVTDDGQGVFRYAGEIDPGTDRFIDNVTPDRLGEALVNDDWIGPPDDDAATYPNGPMQNAVMHPSGFVVGHTKHELVFSEPFTIHAYPAAYRQSLDDEIIGVSLFGNDIFVGTSSAPRLYAGLHPSSMSPVRLSEEYPLANSKAIAEVAGRLYYASPIGLVEVSGTTQTVVSRAFMTDLQWQNYNPSTMKLGRYFGKLVMFCDNTTLVLDTEQPELGISTLGIAARAVFNDPRSSDLFYHAGDGVVRALGKDKDNRTSFTYLSRIVKVPSDISLPFIKVRATSYPVTVTVIGIRDNGSVMERDVVLPSAQFGMVGFRERFSRFQLRVTGDYSIQSIELATSPGELS